MEDSRTLTFRQMDILRDTHRFSKSFLSGRGKQPRMLTNISEYELFELEKLEELGYLRIERLPTVREIYGNRKNFLYKLILPLLIKATKDAPVIRYQLSEKGEAFIKRDKFFDELSKEIVDRMFKRP